MLIVILFLVFSSKSEFTYSPRHPSGATPLFAKRGDGGELVKLHFMLFSLRIISPNAGGLFKNFASDKFEGNDGLIKII